MRQFVFCAVAAAISLASSALPTSVGRAQAPNPRYLAHYVQVLITQKFQLDEAE